MEMIGIILIGQKEGCNLLKETRAFLISLPAVTPGALSGALPAASPGPVPAGSPGGLPAVSPAVSVGWDSTKLFNFLPEVVIKFGGKFTYLVTKSHTLPPSQFFSGQRRLHSKHLKVTGHQAAKAR